MVRSAKLTISNAHFTALFLTKALPLTTHNPVKEALYSSLLFGGTSRHFKAERMFHFLSAARSKIREYNL